MSIGFEQLHEECLAVSTRLPRPGNEQCSRIEDVRGANQDLLRRARRHTNSPNTQICCCASTKQYISEPRRKYQFQNHSFEHEVYMRQADVAEIRNATRVRKYVDECELSKRNYGSTHRSMEWASRGTRPHHSTCQQADGRFGISNII